MTLPIIKITSVEHTSHAGLILLDSDCKKSRTIFSLLGQLKSNRAQAEAGVWWWSSNILRMDDCSLEQRLCVKVIRDSSGIVGHLGPDD